MKRCLIFILVVSFSMTLLARSTLTFEERVKAQEAIERVYYNHRIWPKENPQPKPSFEKMVTKEQIEAKVTDYLKKCSALDQFWKRPIIASQLQAEMDRMAKGTKDPQTLNELFAALDNDPYLIAECLARPALADRLIHNWYANDERFHKETREKAEDALKTLTPESFCSYPEGQYSKMTYRLMVEELEEMEGLSPEDNTIKIDENEFTSMISQIPDDGKISEINENNDSFTIIHTTSKNEAEIKIESLTFAKTNLGEWMKKQNLTTSLPETGSEVILYLPPTPEGACIEGWDNMNNAPPTRRSYHNAVWTGSEMIIWGSGGTNTGGKYNPSTDTWTATSVGANCPSARGNISAVWSGTEMIIWGGYSSGYLNTGGRYNPLTDTWTATSTGTDCPSARRSHTAIWTGAEMIIWGGEDSSQYLNTGGRYIPQTDTWTTISTGTDCPSGRYGHTAVWTNSEMIIWGGGADSGSFQTGGRYNPQTDSWAATSTGTDCPSARVNHSAVWTGSVMIIWGGIYGGFFQTGGCYNPSADTWTATSTGIACPSARGDYSAVWTGTEMIIWGGRTYPGTYSSFNSGGRYNPSTDTWIATSTGANLPTARFAHSAIWTGTEMIVWGGTYYPSSIEFRTCSVQTGGRYNPTTDTWNPTSGPPDGRAFHTAIWTGSEMIIWGGIGQNSFQTGGLYNQSIDTWTATSTGANCPSARQYHSAVWTGTEMIIWGGYGSSPTNKQDGGKYNPLTDTWTATSTGTDCPSARRSHTAIWTGAEMIIWGGEDSSQNLNTGGRYIPQTDTWTAISTGTDCPSSRHVHTAIWTGSEMLVWGGSNGSNLNTGGRYNPSTDSWIATSTGIDCPLARSKHAAVWTGVEMIIWGGAYNTGGRYNLQTDTWTATSVGANCPSARSHSSAIWSGTEMIVWGGYYSSYLNSGGRYNPSVDTWNVTLTGTNCPSKRRDHQAIWAGSCMNVWGGEYDSGSYISNGGIYYIPYAPYNFSNNLSGNNSGCSDSGVLVEWSAPLNWGDSSSGTRTFDVLRDGSPIVTGLSEATLSYTDTTGENGVTYLYQVRANNGCGLSTTTTGMSAADNIGASPDEVSNYNDVFSWDLVSGADGYRLYRGALADLPNLMTSTADGCLRYEGTATSFDCSGDDPSTATGHLYWYLVTAYTGACEGTAGDGTGFTRVLSSSGTCP